MKDLFGNIPDPHNLDLKRIWEAIDKILYYEWDPIGVCCPGDDPDMHPARDEYYSYIPDIYKLLQKKAAQKEIEEHLTNIRLNFMGISKNQTNRDREIAGLLLDISL